MNLYKKLIENEKGSALILTMVVLIAGVLIFSSIASVSLLQRSASSKVRSSTEAFQIADSCVEWSLKQYYEVSAGDSIDSAGGINSVTDVFTWDDDIAGATINMPDTESYEIDCKVYLVDQDGNIIDSSRSSEELIEAVAEIRVVADAGFGDDETRRAVQVGLSGCPETFTDDRDGQEYKAIKIGDQCWMAENLNYGDFIDSSVSMNGSTPITKYCYDDHENNCDTFPDGDPNKKRAGLYQWDEVMQGESSMDGDLGTVQGICPDGWHVPTDDEWHALELEFADGSCDPDRSGAGCSPAGWDLAFNLGDDSGFDLLFCGFLAFDGWDDPDTVLWSSTQVDGNEAFSRSPLTTSDGFARYKRDKEEGLSVRCIKD